MNTDCQQKKGRRGSIAVRISVILIVTVLLPTAFIQMYLTKRYEETMDNYANTYLLNAFESTYANFEKCFENMRAQANYLFLSSALRGAILHSYSGSLDREILTDNNNIRAEFNNCRSIYAQENHEYSFLISDGRIFATWGTLRLPIDTLWLQSITRNAKAPYGNTWFVLDNKTTEGRLSPLPSSFAVAKPISASPYSAVIVSVPIEQLSGYYTNLPDIGGSSMILVFDADNALALSAGHPDASLMNRIRSVTLSAGSKGAVVTHSGTVYIISRSFSLNRWKLIQVFDDAAGSLGGRLLRSHMLTFVIVLSLLALGSVMIAVVFRMTNSIRALDSAVRQFSTDHQLHLLPEKGHDEVAVLTRHVNVMQKRIIALLDQVQKNEKEKMRLYYESKLSEMNPHFLYNTLNSIRWVALFSNAPNVADLLESLGILLRNHTSKADELIQLSEDLQILDHYMNLQYARFGEMIHLKKNIPEEAMSCMLPKFCIQPLVENALIHAFEHQRRKGTISVTVRLENPVLFLTVKDNGAGMTLEQLTTLMNTLKKPETDNDSKSIGLHNIAWRITYLFGPEYGIAIESEKDAGTTVTLRLPIIFHENEVA